MGKQISEAKRKAREKLNECAEKLVDFANTENFSPACLYITFHVLADIYARKFIDDETRDFCNAIIKDTTIAAFKLETLEH